MMMIKRTRRRLKLAAKEEAAEASSLRGQEEQMVEERGEKYKVILEGEDRNGANLVGRTRKSGDRKRATGSMIGAGLSQVMLLVCLLLVSQLGCNSSTMMRTASGKWRSIKVLVRFEVKIGHQRV